jgi:hypothetical protein
MSIDTRYVRTVEVPVEKGVIFVRDLPRDAIISYTVHDCRKASIYGCVGTPTGNSIAFGYDNVKEVDELRLHWTRIRVDAIPTDVSGRSLASIYQPFAIDTDITKDKAKVTIEAYAAAISRPIHEEQAKENVTGQGIVSVRYTYTEEVSVKKGVISMRVPHRDRIVSCTIHNCKRATINGYEGTPTNDSVVFDYSNFDRSKDQWTLARAPIAPKTLAFDFDGDSCIDSVTDITEDKTTVTVDAYAAAYFSDTQPPWAVFAGTYNDKQKEIIAKTAADLWKPQQTDKK